MKKSYYVSYAYFGGFGVNMDGGRFSINVNEPLSPGETARALVQEIAKWLDNDVHDPVIINFWEM